MNDETNESTTNGENNPVFELLRDLLERNPEFDYKRRYVRLSSAPFAGALLYVRQKLTELKDTYDTTNDE